MSLNYDSPEICDYLKRIEEVRISDPDTALDVCYELYELAQSDGDEDLKHLTSCLLGEACCRCDDFTEGFMYLSTGISNVCLSKRYELSTRFLNVLGLCYQYQNNYINAQECYFACMDEASEAGLPMIDAMAAHNFASLCEELHDYEDSLPFRYRAIESLDKVKDVEDIISYKIINLCYIVRLYIRLDDKEHAIIVRDQLMEELAKAPDMFTSFGVTATGLLYYHYMGDKEQEEMYKQMTIEAFYACSEYLIYFEECEILAEYLLDTGEFDKLGEFLDLVEASCVDEICTNQKLKVARCKVLMFEKMGDHQAALEFAYKYMQLDATKMDAWEKSFASSVRLSASLNQLMAEHISEA